MDFSSVWSQWPLLLDGCRITLQLVFVSAGCGLLLALPLGLMRLSRQRRLRWLAGAYVGLFRGTPLLVQIFLVYYGLAQFELVRSSLLWPLLQQPYWCAIIALTLNTAAYSAEIVRASIAAIPVGEVEAARALGLSGLLLGRYIVLPRALVLGLPAYGNELVLMLKGSALASTITLLDLTGAARTIIAGNFRPVETFAVAGLIYWSLAWLIGLGLAQLERRLQPPSASSSASAAK